MEVHPRDIFFILFFSRENFLFSQGFVIVYRLKLFICFFPFLNLREFFQFLLEIKNSFYDRKKLIHY